MMSSQNSQQQKLLIKNIISSVTRHQQKVICKRNVAN